MKSFVHCAIALACAAGTSVFAVLTVTDSFVYIVFAITGAVLTSWHLRSAREAAQAAAMARIPAAEVSPYDRNAAMNAAIMEQARRSNEELTRFRMENIELLTALEREYRRYITEAFEEEDDFPVALSTATERMMSKYGDGIYPAFKETNPGFMLCLSPSLYIADLEAARTFLSTVRIQ